LNEDFPLKYTLTPRERPEPETIEQEQFDDVINGVKEELAELRRRLSSLEKVFAITQIYDAEIGDAKQLVDEMEKLAGVGPNLHNHEGGFFCSPFSPNAKSREQSAEEFTNSGKLASAFGNRRRRKAQK